jgi:pyruvate/oxaloacetate carboxyltransferase/biotin carboxyl carrier protein
MYRFRNAASLRSFSTAAPKRVFDPKKILPSGMGQVRVINNTTRDAQQSNLSAEMADVHRQEVGKMINDCYKTMNTEVRGYEQTWGGTIPMFDIWKRGVQPFEESKRMTAHMPDTPASALIRSNGINSMSNQPKDVVDEFIRLAAQAGVNVYTNFCAHNDWRNHVNVAEAVHKYGQHYQAALSWAVYHQDPTIYNVQWVVDFFKQVMPLNPHSLYIKDPSGVLTPEMAGLITKAVKNAYPHLPLVFHTHYQTGYGYMAYLEAAKNGANGVECSLGFADGAGQPYGLTMLRAFEEFGFDTGNPDKAAMEKINAYCNEIRPLYKQGRVVRTPDIGVEKSGIAGGQRSILDKELTDAGQPHLIPEVDIQVQLVRAQGGKVCQVTPVADSYAREAMRRLRGGSATSGFVPGYAGILVGEGGLVKEPVDAGLQKSALDARAALRLSQLLERKAITKDTHALIAKSVLSQLRAVVDELSRPVVLRARLAEVRARLDQLARVRADPEQAASLARKIAMAQAVTGVASIAQREQLLANEATAIEAELAAGHAQQQGLTDAEYAGVLRAAASESVLARVLARVPAAAALLQQNLLTAKALQELLAHSGVVTVCHSDLLPAGLPAALREVEALEREHGLDLTSNPVDRDENVLLYAAYSKAAIPNLILNFFKNYKTNPGYWPQLYENPAPKPQQNQFRSTAASPLTTSVAALYLLMSEGCSAARAAPEADPASPWNSLCNTRFNLGAERREVLLSPDSAGAEQPIDFRIAYDAEVPGQYVFTFDQGVSYTGSLRMGKDKGTFEATLNGHKYAATCAMQGQTGVSVAVDGCKVAFSIPQIVMGKGGSKASEAVAPMSGTVIKVLAKARDAVTKGQPLVVVEAMKMEHVIKAPADGVVREVLFKQGDFVDGGKILVTFEADAAATAAAKKK